VTFVPCRAAHGNDFRRFTDTARKRTVGPLTQSKSPMPVPITLKSPLPAKDLMFESMTASDGLSMLGEMQLGLVSEKADLKPQDLLGKPITVSVALADDKKRHFHGYVTRFGIGAHRGRYFGYQASVRPWLWFLTRTADCRIFQELSVPDIVKKVFEDHGTANFEFKLFRSYRKWVYCVQYRETDYNFIARLLEHEGIYWYIEHGDGTSKVVLVDSQSAHDAAPGCESLPYYENAAASASDTECISAWTFASEVETDKVELTSYDFERPSTSLKADAKKSHTYTLPDFEMFDFQGDYVQAADGSQWAEDRLDEHQARFQMAHGGSNAHGIEVGRLLELAKHPRADQNSKYLITAISVNAHVDAYESDSSAGAFRCDFSAIPSAQQFRPQRRTPKPFMQGPQTAVVVGPGGEEIFTDKHGRVKVQFHWDRLGKKNEKSSCWVRVSQPWAGKGWGAVSIPRIGQEVVVDFLEGDPDQPIVTGRVYNAEQTPPFPLPEGAVVSGIKSKSHKATGYNEMSMDDTPGKEKFTIHGQYDMASTIEHDQTTTVHNNRTDTIDVDDTESVGNDQTQSVGNNHKQTVKVNQTIKVGNNQDLTVGASRTKHIVANEKNNIDVNQDTVIGGARTLKVTDSDSVDIGSTQTVNIKLLKTETIGAAYVLSVGAVMNQAVGAALLQEVAGAKVVGVGALSTENVALSKSIKAGTNISFEATAKMAHKSGAAYSAEAGATMSFKSTGDYSVTSSAKAGIDAASELVLKCGSAEIILKSGGEISIKGSSISVNGSGKIVVDASGDLNLKGSKINNNS
jgi:type VI secretion system secreted protein VgrG